MVRPKRLLAFTIAWSLAGTATFAHAHPDEQHGGDEGHLAPVTRNVEVVGELDLFADDHEHPGRISDVAAFGDHAYLGAFREPDCEDGGVYVVDISDPSAPEEVGFIPASPFSYVGEGVQVVHLETDHFRPGTGGQVLVHNNENCTPVDGALPAGRGGVSLWDVTDPTAPERLADHAGDGDLAFSGSLPHRSWPHQSHSAFAWQQDDRAYLVMVDNGELGTTDIDILDITDPRNPELVVETGMADFPEIAEDPAPNGSNAFLHDMVVKQIGERFVLLASYWDGGYLTLDVTGLPQGEAPTLLADTDFGEVEPLRGAMGLPETWTPEGNAHQAEFSHDNAFILAADEDFGPHRIAGVIAGGTYRGHTFSATQGSDTPAVEPGDAVSGPTVFVGEACGVAPPATSPDQIALIERGTCTFTVKTAAVEAAGYQAGIVFNDRTQPDCDAQVNMLAVGNIPFMFVGRADALRIFDTDPGADSCDTGSPTVGTAGADIDISAIFDGWGYLHLYDAANALGSGDGPLKMEAIDHWALPESLEAENATGFGDLSIHEVATHPSENLAFISHYSGGFRVVAFDEQGIREVGAFVDEGGNNLWGVEVHEVDGEVLALASDRDSGLYVLRYVPDDGRPERVPPCSARGRDGERGRPTQSCVPDWLP